MYQFSRAIYRELAHDILLDPRSAVGLDRNHARVLRACEAAVERLVSDRHYFARPTRSLFNEIRPFFPMNAQLKVLRTVDRYLSCAAEWLDRQPQPGCDLHGNPLRCRATTRRGTACQRSPLPRLGYCPSHQHLAETESVGTFAA
jgi:hypothetical protein